MYAKRIIRKSSGSVKELFYEKCLCGEPRIKIEENNPDYATCSNCLRVVRIMSMIVPEGILEWWGIYFDPYLANTLVGQFLNYLSPLDPNRFPKDN